MHRGRAEIQELNWNMTPLPFYRKIVLIKVNAWRTNCDISHADKLLSIRPDSALQPLFQSGNVQTTTVIETPKRLRHPAQQKLPR